MADSFSIAVSWKNNTHQFDAELRPFGYTYRIIVWVNEIEIAFEPDEERNFRALVPPDTNTSKLPDAGLLEAIAIELETNLK